MAILPVILCEECDSPIAAPSFCCPCGWEPCSEDLQPMVEQFLDTLPSVPGQPKIVKYMPSLLTYQGTTVLPIILLHFYKTALDAPRIVYCWDKLRECILAK